MDGLIICGDDSTLENRARVDASLTICADRVDSLGLDMPDRHLVGQVEKVIGYEPIRHPARFTLGAKRSAFLFEALRFLTKCICKCKDNAHRGIYLDMGSIAKSAAPVNPTCVVPFY